MEPESNLPAIGTAGPFVLHMKLGEGGQANVYLASNNHQLYALKIYLPGPSKEEAFQLQVNFLQTLKSPLLINLVDSEPKALVQLGNLSQEKRPMLVLDLADGGELYDYIAKQGRLSPEVCRFYAKQMVSALQYFSSHDIAHRDIKPENILLDSKFNIKISDFGLARDSKGRFGDYVLRSRVGTEGYRSPEMEEGKYNGLQSDMFSVGVVLFVMYNGSPPFMSTKPHDRIYKLIRDKHYSKFWEKHEKSKPEGFYSRPFKRLINSFFSAEADRRPTFESLENDEWWNEGDVTQDQLEEYMKPKSEVLFEDNPITAFKKVFFKKKIQQQMAKEECVECVEGECTRDCPEEFEEQPIQEQFAQTYKNIHIVKEDLPQFTITNLPYSQQEPAFVVAWVKDAISSFFKENEVFLEDFVEQIKPHHFDFNYDQESFKVDLRFEFIIEEEYATEVELRGQLHRSDKGGVGISWVKKEGNSFWLAAIEKRIADQLKQIN